MNGCGGESTFGRQQRLHRRNSLEQGNLFPAQLSRYHSAGDLLENVAGFYNRHGMEEVFEVIVIGGGHAGAEAAWAAANLGAKTALVTMDPARIGAMSCNPAIGGLAKGQIVREIDAMGGLMGLAADATGIQFKVLNASKGPAVRGPRCQNDKYRYAAEVQRLLRLRKEITIMAGTVERILVEKGRVRGVELADGQRLQAGAVVLTTGTFLRGLMHRGPKKIEGGRYGEPAAVGLSQNLKELGFELGRLKTGTPPRLAAETINWAELPVQWGDVEPVPFSAMTGQGGRLPWYQAVAERFPVLEQRPCWVTYTNETIHEVIRQNRDRAPLFNGQIESIGPRYCPSIEDKVFRFPDKTSHHVFLEPESLDTNEIYCNGISTSLPEDVQEFIVTHLPGCQRAKILRYGYAVEYDMVWPYQIDATCMSKRVEGLFLAGQINGTSGYEEAAGQGLLAGLNAVRYLRAQELIRLGRQQAYIGVLMDDLVTRVPREPYRMFTSRAEWRLMLRADNADQRLTPLARSWGLIDEERWRVFQNKEAARQVLLRQLEQQVYEGRRLIEWVRRPEIGETWILERLDGCPLPAEARKKQTIAQVLADIRYAGYLQRQERDWQRLKSLEEQKIPLDFDYSRVKGLRTESRLVLEQFRPATLGQASRLAGVTPADIMLLAVVLKR